MAWRTTSSWLLAHTVLLITVTILADATAATSPAITAPATSTVSILLPRGCLRTIDGSIIAANLTQTVYELSWNPVPLANDTGATTCPFVPPMTMTQGPSTLIYTATPTSAGTNPLVQPYQPTTIQCLIVGANLEVTPIVPAQEAICTGTVPISGLGYYGSTSVVPSDKIEFVGVTVTAGVAKLASASPIITFATSLGQLRSAGTTVLADTVLAQVIAALTICVLAAL